MHIHSVKSVVFLILVLSISLLNTARAENTRKVPTKLETLSALETEKILDQKFAEGKYSRTGADQCLRCHDESSDTSAMGIFTNVHGSRQVKGSPFQGLQCEACHGPAGEHIKSRLKDDEVREPMITFGTHSPVPSGKQNSVCLSCHEDDQRKHWVGGAHERGEVACASCHKVHQAHDPVSTRDTQAQTCGSCHTEQLAQLHQRSSHPMQWGQMVCTDCHNPHGSDNPVGLKQPTINDNCYSCHAEKRGPFLWEHEPVTENCGTCHNPHGSINKNMLTQRAPQLCQSCHTTAGHPSVPYSGSKDAQGQPSAFVMGQSCMNCHSQVHGSNHPSGNALQR